MEKQNTSSHKKQQKKKNNPLDESKGATFPVMDYYEYSLAFVLLFFWKESQQIKASVLIFDISYLLHPLKTLSKHWVSVPVDHALFAGK